MDEKFFSSYEMHNTHPILASLYHSMSPFKYTNSVTCSVLLRLGDDPEVPIAARQTRKTPDAESPEKNPGFSVYQHDVPCAFLLLSLLLYFIQLDPLNLL